MPQELKNALNIPAAPDRRKAKDFRHRAEGELPGVFQRKVSVRKS
jgi:hypothetical protein